MDTQASNAMSDNFKRLATFQYYPVPEARDANRTSLLRYNSPLKLSNAGFYRYPDAPCDEVRCYKCSVKYRGWSGEPPLAVHRILSPDCLHVVSQTPARLTAPTSRVGANRVRRRLQLEPSSSNQPSDDISDGSGNQRRVTEVYNALVNPGTPDQSDTEDDGTNHNDLFESHRLLTFPSPTHPHAEEWASTGFVHTGEGGVVRCVFCGLELEYESEHPSKMHQQQSPNCPLVKYLDSSVGNITRELENKVRAQYLEQTNGKYCEDTSSETLFKHPQFEGERDRMDTFKYWPRQLRPNADMLSQAGFFFSGHADKVVCFACGFGLRNWAPEADPWTQHARHAPSCVFVKQEKGDNFITLAQDAPELTDFDPPSDSSTNPSSPCSAFRPSLDLSAVKAALECNYDVQQIRHAVLKFFLSSRGFYPNDTLLLGTLRAMDVNFSQLQRQREQIHNKDLSINKKDQELQQMGQVIERNHEVIEENQTYLEREQRERERREREVRELRVQLNRERTRVQSQASVIQTRHQQLENTLVQLQDKQHQLGNRDSELERKQREMDRQSQEMRRKEEEVRRKEEEVRQKDEENRRQAEEMEKLRQLLIANNININHLAAPAALVAPAAAAAPVAAAAAPAPADQSSSSYTRCKVCLEEDARCIFRPCRHVCCGTECAPRFIGDKCPICRDSVRDWEIIYVA